MASERQTTQSQRETTGRDALHEAISDELGRDFGMTGVGRVLDDLTSRGFVLTPAEPSQAMEQRVARVVASLKEAFGVRDLADIDVFFGEEPWWRERVRRMLEAADGQ